MNLPRRSVYLIFPNEKRTCEIGYELMTRFQGQGIMKEAAEKVIEYAFRTLQFKQIVALTHNGNKHSIKLLMKLKFTKSKETHKENPEYSIYTLTNSN